MERDGEQLIDAYVDGLLAGPQREAFERDLARDESLRRPIEQMARLNEALARVFAPPPVEAALARIDAARRAPSSVTAAARGWRLGRVAAIAAVLVLSIAGAWRLWGPLSLSTGYRLGLIASNSLEDAYYRQVELLHFEPAWICKDDVEFAQTFDVRMGLPLVFGLAELPPNVKPNGLAYGRVFSRNTIYVLVYVDGREVMVFVDRLENDRPTRAAWWCDMHVFRHEVDGAVLYEYTPFDRPAVANLFRPPDEATLEEARRRQAQEQP
ncbi:MAG: hypothetical protein C4547_01205 [Phycisphaerales bacterium]|nr:MAG: hypothetical protein C4547_01205 [Phycisphaerales bacterium]